MPGPKLEIPEGEACSTTQEDLCRNWAQGSLQVSVERPRRRQKPGSYEQKYAAVSESGTKMGNSGSHLRKVLLTPGWTGNFLVVAMGNPQALSEMGARMLNDLGCSGPLTFQGLVHHPPPCPSSPTGRS